MPRPRPSIDARAPRTYRRTARLALRLSVGSVGVATVLGCVAPGGSSDASSDVQPAAPTLASGGAERVPAAVDSARVRSAERAPTAWLEASQESAAAERDVAAANLLAACPDDGGAYFPSMLLADYQLHASVMPGDTVVARARMITVAEQDVDRRADGFMARERVWRDVLEWDLVPIEALQRGQGWAICNKLRFGYRGADSLMTWRPEGSSWQSARRLADSVRATRPLAPAAIRQRIS